MRKPPGPATETFQLRIDKLIYGGWGLGKHDGKVVLVPFTVPGDQLEVRAELAKKSYLRASVVRILQPGPGRLLPPCTHFGACGGCQWQPLDYPRQVDAKRVILEELFRHHFPETGSLPIGMTGSPRDYQYRSRARLQLQFRRGALQVGFFRFQSHAVEDVERCPLLRPALNQALTEARGILRSQPPAELPREFDLCCSEEEGRWAASGIELPNAVSHEPLKRKAGSHHYWVLPETFFQANDFMIDTLVETVMGLAPAMTAGSALDLFSGVGLLSLPLAGSHRRVLAVESGDAAARLCERNAAEAALQNIRVVRADVLAWIEAVGSLAPPAFDLVVLDPPRAGAGREVMGRLAEWAPEAIIYVSCDPQTLVRDLAALPAGQYRIDRVEGLDLFPQTFHFETIVRLRRR